MSEDVSNSELRAAPLAYENRPFLTSPDGRILRAVAHGIAQHVLDGAAQQVAVAVDGRARRAFD